MEDEKLREIRQLIKIISGFVSQDHIGGFSMKWEYAKTTHKHTIP
jgi:hypothetical protein